MVAKKQNSIDNSKGGMVSVAMIGAASIVAAPFTSLWVPVGVITFLAIIIGILSLLNKIVTKTKRPVIKSFAQIYKAFGWAADYFRF